MMKPIRNPPRENNVTKRRANSGTGVRDSTCTPSPAGMEKKIKKNKKKHGSLDRVYP
jgi:hypothetical protein